MLTAFPSWLWDAPRGSELDVKPKVLIVTTTSPRWRRDSMPVFIEDFAKSISDRCEVHVLAPHTKGAKLYEDLKGVQVFRFRYAPDQFERFGAGISVIEIVRKDPWTLLDDSHSCACWGVFG